KPQAQLLPSILAAPLLAEIIFIVRGDGSWLPGKRVVSSKEVSLALYGPYLLVIELASMLLLAGLIGAYHLGRRDPHHDEGRR
ncbi:MAG TPA: NADH-quinone oxidoreductase subunit J, partial [Candidatus Hydrogenedentes bacterium]|nr:NADH-quinone oxidoreductase subunit J [Candidatus Hydrogenedentota bacterium]